MVEEGIINQGTFHDKNKQTNKTEKESCFYFVIINYARPVTLFLKNEKKIQRKTHGSVYFVYRCFKIQAIDNRDKVEFYIVDDF